SNRGIEIEVDGEIIRKEDFGWSLFGNYSAFDTKIEELPLLDEESPLVLSTIYGSRGTVEARLGGRFGDMYGLGYLRTPDGQIIYSNGLPEFTEDLIHGGNPNPRQKYGIASRVRYKDIHLKI